MAGLIAVTAAFVVAIINAIYKDKIEPGRPTVLGLSRPAALAVVIIAVGMIFNIVKEVQSRDQAQRRALREQRLTQNLESLMLKLEGVEKRISVASGDIANDPARREIEDARDELSAIRAKSKQLEEDDRDD